MSTIPIEERIAIQELVNLYPLYCDTHQFEKLFNLFTEECIFDETSVGATRVTTRAAMRELFQRAPGRLGPLMHSCTNHIISSFSDGAAGGACHVVAEGIYNIEGQQKPFRIFGYYDDRYVKVDGRWYFKSRTLKLLVPSQGAPTVGGIIYDVTAEIFAIR